jgi:hypothetical protein
MAKETKIIRNHIIVRPSMYFGKFNNCTVGEVTTPETLKYGEEATKAHENIDKALKDEEKGN